MKKAIIILLAAFGTFFVSCQSNTYEEISKISTPTYSDNIQSVVKSNCTACHNPNGTRSSSPLDTYEDLVNFCKAGTGGNGPTDNGFVLCRISDDSCGSIMPPTGKMPQTTIDLIKLWATQGYAK